MELTNRPRRLRKNQTIRDMVRETRISEKGLILPIFIKEGKGIVEEIPSMPGQYHYSPDMLSAAIERCTSSGVDKVLLFGLPKEKDLLGSGAWDDSGIVQQGIAAVKSKFPQVAVATDVCMCEYTSHGHCGILRGSDVNNDRTVELLTKTAVSHARAGADIVAPSDMMDGRVAAIRGALDSEAFDETMIMSYAAKYASSFYGPFRQAADCAPSFGDRRAYQMDYHNSREALKECILDEREGADIIMIKPALSYLDIISRASRQTNLPVAAYSVSGEYAMIKSAAAAGMLDEYGVMCESAVSVFRAGADILISYFAVELAQAIRKGDVG